MSDSQTKTIQTYHRLMEASAMTQIFLTARNLRLFEKLREGQQTATQLAGDLGLAVRPLELLLDALVETGYVEKYSDDYALSVLGKMLPVEWSDLGSRYWAKLESWVRDGQRLEASDTDFDQTEYGLESKAFEWMGTPNALELIKILNIGQDRQGLRMIELDCGSAVYSAACGYHDPEMKVCLVDSAENLERARSTTDSVEISDRCQFIEADSTRFSATFEADLVILANGLCRYDDTSLARLLKNAAQHLKKTGEIAIVDQFSEQDQNGFANKVHGLLTELRTPVGRRRSKKETTEVLYDCGFVDAMYSDLKSPPGTKGVLVAGVSRS